MNTPPGLVGAAVLFWGWQTALLPLAVVAALILEASRLVPWRWHFARAEFDRLADLSTLLLLGAVVYLGLTAGANRAVIGVLQWLPLICLPLVASQALSGGEPIELATLFWTLRRQARREGAARSPGFNLAYPYVALCVLSASAANVRSGAFYVAVCVLAAWALWSVRPRHVSAAVWVGAVLGVSLLGYGGHLGLHDLQQAIEARITEWFEALIGRHVDPFRTTTHIGQIGTLKLGAHIVLRVEPREGRAQPLLREATYNAYHSSTWFAVDSSFAEVPPESDGATWKLRPATGRSGAMTVSGALRRGKGVLALPGGAFELQHLPAVGLKVSRLGAVKVDEGPAFVSYTALLGPGSSLDGPPTENDLKLPPQEAPLLSRVVEDLRLRSQPAPEALATLGSFFRTRFQYAMFVPERTAGPAALEDFLVRSRAGHCEYFATATVLLLRAAGMPARYAVGYSTDEFSRFENRYIVRARHAHAWALAYIDGAWRDVDTTPGEWRSAEAATASALEPFWDLWSWAGFLFSRWRWSEGQGTWAGYLGWFLIPLSAALIWRIYSRTRRGRAGARTDAPERVAARPGADSEFYMVERRLAELGFERAPGEPLTPWIRRIEATRPASITTAPIEPLVRLHYRYRFDPLGVSASDREALRATARSWLASHDAAGVGEAGT
jgi:hypothetical protein